MKNLLLLLLIFSLHVWTKLHAQAMPSGNLPTRKDSSGANWKIFTDPESRKTRVQFLASDQTLLYEEEIPEKWIKQNRRNRQRLDRLLADISATKLIVSRLMTQDLPAEPVAVAISTKQQSGDLSGEENSYKIHVAINSDGKIRVAVDNPKNLRYKIEIADYREKIIYQEFTTLNKYRRHIDISPVVSQAVKLIFSIDRKRLVYNITREQQKSNYTLTPAVAQL